MSEYAPEYTQKEKLRYFIKVCVISLPICFVLLYWLMPWFHHLVVSSSCTSLAEIRGLNVIVYSLFVGLPITAGVMLFATMGPGLIKSIKFAQYPLPGEKVLSKTKYIFGSQARVRAYIILFLLSSTFIVAIQGFFWAKELLYLLLYSSVPSCI